MVTPSVTVVRGKFARSWPERIDRKTGELKVLRPSDRADVLPLGEALERTYASDAHFAAYASPNGYRLNCEALAHGVEVSLTCVVFDVDGPGHAATPTWRRDLRERVCALAEVHPRPFYAETRGGARIIYTQAEPTIIRSRDDAEQWSRVYLTACAYLRRRFGIEADTACRDWQRLYRAPHATRDAGGEPENLPAYPNPHDIGPLEIDASWDDVEHVRATSKAFRKGRDLVFTGGNGDGLLYWLLRHRGDVGSEAPRGGWVCRCPNRAAHTTGTDGTDATVVYQAASGKELGAIHCLHAHCQGIDSKGWLRFFSDSEIEAARRAAGIGRAA